MSVHFLYDADAIVERVGLLGKPTADLVRFNDAVGAGAWGFRHECQRFADQHEPDGVFVKLVAPRLTNHTVTRDENGVTVRASILCPDCGLHGFVTNSQWVHA